MFRSDNFLTWLTSATIAALLVFLSCAQKETDESGDFAESTVEDISPTADGNAEGGSKPPASDLESTVDSPVTNNSGSDDFEKMLAEGRNSAPAAEAPNELETALAENPGPAVSPEADLGQSPAENVVQESATKEIQAPEESAPKHSGVKRSAIRHHGGGHARIPQIPGRAVQKKGVLLNRFYFTRKGDNAGHLSALLYGDKNHAQALTAWNTKGKLGKPGSLIYYNSPFEPGDTAMKSFYQERQVPFEEHPVASGEWLSTIAKKKLGASESWTEIAVVNGIDSPQKLEKGKKLAIYPADLSGFTASRVASAKPEPPPQASVPPAPTPQKQQPPPTQQAHTDPDAGNNSIPPGGTETPEPAPPPVAKKSAEKEMDFGAIIEQNLLAFGVGGLVLILLVALSVYSRRKKARRLDDMNEDGFSAPPKAKRK